MLSNVHEREQPIVFQCSIATLWSSMEKWELGNVFASIMLPIWYKAARMRSLTNPTRH